MMFYHALPVTDKLCMDGPTSKSGPLEPGAAIVE